MNFTRGTGENSWHVIHTRSRHEKKFYGECEKMAITAYLPLVVSTSIHKGRIFEFTKPLFPGYLFCCFHKEQRKAILKTRHVANILEVVDQDGLLRELTEIEKAIKLKAELTPYAYLDRGTRVIIVDGPFRGVEGIIARRNGKFRLVLNVTFIEMAAAVEVYAHQVEPVERVPA
jgi:transcription antitermination factor NusG